MMSDSSRSSESSQVEHPSQAVSSLRNKWERLSKTNGHGSPSNISGVVNLTPTPLTLPTRRRNLSSTSASGSDGPSRPPFSIMNGDHSGHRIRTASDSFAIRKEDASRTVVGTKFPLEVSSSANKRRPPPPIPLRRKTSFEGREPSTSSVSDATSRSENLIDDGDSRESSVSSLSVKSLREKFGSASLSGSNLPSSTVLPSITRAMSPAPIPTPGTGASPTPPRIKLSMSSPSPVLISNSLPPALPPRTNINSRTPSRPALTLDLVVKSPTIGTRTLPPPVPPPLNRPPSRGPSLSPSPSPSSATTSFDGYCDDESDESYGKSSDESIKTPVVEASPLVVPPRLPARRPPGTEPRPASLPSSNEERTNILSPPPSHPMLGQPPPLPLATRPVPTKTVASAPLIDVSTVPSSSTSYLRPSTSTTSLPVVNMKESVGSAPTLNTEASLSPDSKSAPLPPPPTRTIPLGAVPPPRRKESASTSESEAEMDRKAPGIARRDVFPDASNSSRRLPLLPHPYKPLSIPSSSTTVSPSALSKVKGPLVVFGGCPAHYGIHTFRWYDLKECIWREGEFGERKITALEWAPDSPQSEGGNRAEYLWAGTKDGALLLLKLSTAPPSSTVPDFEIVGQRLGWHASPIQHLVRYGNKMLSVDEGGKCVLFSCASSVTDSNVKPLVRFRHPVSSIAPTGISWVSVINNMAWIAHGNGLRVYSLEEPAARPVTLIPSSGSSDKLGSILCGTVIPSRPGRVHTGHEGGVISTWCYPSISGSQDYHFLGMTKIGVSDVLCLVGLNNRLWAAGRTGVVSIYALPPLNTEGHARIQVRNAVKGLDTPGEDECRSELWGITNEFVAHLDVPIVSLVVDPFSIEKLGRLAVISVGRDEQLKFWDGLLGTDWIESKVAAHEKEFSVFRSLKVLICTWNVDAARPDALSSGGQDNLQFLSQCLGSVDRPDIICFGFQEMIDLNDRKLTAKTVLLGRKKKDDVGSNNISEKVTRAYKQWHDKLVLAVRLAMPADDPYIVLHTESLVGLFTCIFVRMEERSAIANAHVNTIKRGMKGLYGNKGAIVARVVIDDSSLAFINCHLAAGQNHKIERNKDVAAILEEKEAFPPVVSVDSSDALAYVGGGNGSMILDHEICFLNGDLNYRIDHRRDAVIQTIAAGEYENLLQHDQLLKEIAQNPGFRLSTFREAPITFAPTYKFDPFTSNYDSSEKNRIPAWCDRILYKTRDFTRVQALNYQRYEVNVSDHRPVSAGFKISVKKVNHETRKKVKIGVEEEWQLEEQRLLLQERSWFRELGILV